MNPEEDTYPSIKTEIYRLFHFSPNHKKLEILKESIELLSTSLYGRFLDDVYSFSDEDKLHDLLLKKVG